MAEVTVKRARDKLDKYIKKYLHFKNTVLIVYTKNVQNNSENNQNIL